MSFRLPQAIDAHCGGPDEIILRDFCGSDILESIYKYTMVALLKQLEGSGGCKLKTGHVVLEVCVSFKICRRGRFFFLSLSPVHCWKMWRQCTFFCMCVLMWVSFHRNIAKLAVRIFLKPSHRKSSGFREACYGYYFFFFAFSSCVSVFHCVRFVTSSSSFSPLPVFIVVVDCVCVCTQLCRRGTHGGKILFC